MAALAGILSPRGEASGSRVEHMLAAVPHRGDRTATVTMGACTLGTASRDDDNEVSLISRDGLAAVLVGRIDNATEVAAELRVPMAGFFEQAGLVIEAYRRFGAAFPARLRGVFAGAVTDGASLYCFRDHLGFAPLFYRDDGRGLFVASEAKQIVAGAGIPKAPNTEVLDRIFYETFDDEGACALAGVRRLPKASVLTAARQDVSISRYWSPERLLETARLSSTEIQHRFDDLMAQAVRRTIRGRDVVTLSGGIDSPAVAAFAAPEHLKRTGRPLSALTAIYPDHPAVDERVYVEPLARQLGITLRTYEPRVGPLDGLETWVRLVDGPFPTTSLAEAHELYELVREMGFSNVLTGELAEFVVDLRANLMPHLLARGRIRAGLRYLRLQRARGGSLGGLMRQVVATFVPARIQTSFGRGRGRTGFLSAWIDPPVWARAVVPPPPPRDRWRQAQVGAFIGPGLSIEADEIVQAMSGVHVRRPWADVDLWEFFLSLRAEVKFPDPRSKTLVRRLLKGRLPGAILDRRTKTVFDDAVRARIDYALLRRWLISPTYRVVGVDYAKLATALEREDLDVTSFILARDLAAIHAFLGQW